MVFNEIVIAQGCSGLTDSDCAVCPEKYDRTRRVSSVVIKMREVGGVIICTIPDLRRFRGVALAIPKRDGCSANAPTACIARGISAGLFHGNFHEHRG